jgi:anti-sigma regulatory factor (Ser/Thr protein kinase)
VSGVCCEKVLRLPSPPLAPGPDAVTRHLSLDPVPASVGVARDFVKETLADLEPQDVDTALLLVSELVTNAILHTHTPVQVGVVVDQGQALVCVADRVPGQTLTPRSHSRDRPGGRGLALVAELSEDWGTTSYTGGKTVWFTLPVVTATTARAG